MTRNQREGPVAYRDRRWGGSLLHFFLVFPVALLLVQDASNRRDRQLAWAAGGGALASVLAAFALLRTNPLIGEPGRA